MAFNVYGFKVFGLITQSRTLISLRHSICEIHVCNRLDNYFLCAMVQFLLSP